MSFSLLHNPIIPEDIHLAIEKLSGLKEREASIGALLDESEQKEYEAISNQRRRMEFVSTRYLVKGLADKFGFSQPEFHIRKDALGKPYGESGQGHIFLSIAHCHNEVMCGLSAHRDLGVDLEPVDRRVHEGLKRRIFHPEENEEITNLELIRIWTIKEALVKLEGGGLRTNLNELSLERKNETEFAARFNNDKSARICSFEYDDHWISVAYYEYQQ